MSDMNPPPDEPIPDQARARIRAELLEAAQAPEPARRWLVPVGVAAAVVVVVGLAAWAVRPGGGAESDGAPAAVPSSVTSATSDAPASPGPPRISETAVALPLESDPTVPGDAGTAHQAGTGTCEQEMANVLPGAEVATSFGKGTGQWATSFWVEGDRFVLCDVRAGVTTVHRPLPLDPAEQVSTYAVSSVSPDWPHSSAVVRVAGGIVPEGATAFDVRYTFPNGATRRADTVTDDQGRTWWRVLIAYEDGGGNELDKPPIQVTVSYSGVQKTYTLRWGLDTCAQANHGC